MRHTIELEVSDERAMQVLTGAVDASASDYWLDVERVTRARGGVVKIEGGNIESGQSHTIDAAVVRLGLQRILSGACVSTPELLRQAACLVAGLGIDASRADDVIQAGLFGEISYG